jgi:hypothetical protein
MLHLEMMIMDEDHVYYGMQICQNVCSTVDTLLVLAHNRGLTHMWRYLDSQFRYVETSR